MSIDDLIDGERVAPPQVVAAPPPASAAPQGPTQPLSIGVTWGDFVAIEGHIHLAGHYEGVMPNAAEAALDAAVSRDDGRRLIAEHTRRRWLVGALGEVAFFPGPALPGRVHRAGVVGLGRVGTFSPLNAQVLFAALLREVGQLPEVTTAVLVPIGAGAGNLDPETVATAMVRGFVDALQADAPSCGLRRVVVGEVDGLVAERLHRALRRAAADRSPFVEVDAAVAVGVKPRLGRQGAALRGLRGVLTALGEADLQAATTRACASVPGELTRAVEAGLEELLGQPERLIGLDLAHTDRAPTGAGGRVEAPPTRLSARQSTGGVSWSLLTARATVPEREVLLADETLSALAERLSNPQAPLDPALTHLLTAYVVPPDLRPHLSGDAPLVLELDRYTARLPWEFLVPDCGQPTPTCQPLAVTQCLSRQMRTGYARTDIEVPPAGRHRALVVGDPGDPRREQDLPQARKEAEAVARLLEEAGFVVDALIGAPGTPRVANARPAAMLDVLALLLTGSYDIVHYSGHGTFDPARPHRSGWVFADGVLTARELSQLRRAPWLVVMNACWSLALSADAHADATAAPAVEQQTSRPWELAPVLADEFLRVGTGHVVGTSWQVPDEPARRFAHDFYQGLLGTGDSEPVAVGHALLGARKTLHARWRAAPRPEVACVWAAYQHYGDPTDRFPLRPAPGSPVDDRRPPSTDEEDDRDSTRDA